MNKMNKYLTWAEVDLKAARHNIREIAKLTARNKFFLPTRPHAQRIIQGKETILAVVKADAYGHGAEEIVPLLDREGVGFFAVSNIAEGAALRAMGAAKPVLLFESALASQAAEAVRYNLMPTVCTLELARALQRTAQKQNKRVDVHVKVDTGMGRLGVWHEEAFEFIRRVGALSCLRIMGIFTHFPSADTDRRFTKSQLKLLYHLVLRLDRRGLVIPYIHAANSMGIAGYETHILNLSRPGLMLYGLYPRPDLRKKISLKPVLSVRSRVIFLKDVKRGRSISYGRTFLAGRDTRVATVPIGYSDGYFRALSGRAAVLIDGARCPVLGRVTMDQIMVDVSGVKNIKLGAAVTVLGRQKGGCISADELAGHAGTVNYEVVCALGGRLPRVCR
jgi:alanine racemase